jgi:undecaprenyl-diphosphatase
MLFSDTFNAWLPHAAALGLWNYWIMFAIAFFESIPFIGIIIPGTFALIFVGFLANSGAFDVGDMMWFAAFGAIVGDIVGYMLGRWPRLRARFSTLLPAEALAPSEQFVQAHGGKSVFLGRFVGPIRPFVSYLAGAFHMKPKVFLFWNVVSGFLWACGYLLLGYLFGEAWRRALALSSRIGWATIAGATLLLAIWVWRQRRKFLHAKANTPPAAPLA